MKNWKTIVFSAVCMILILMLSGCFAARYFLSGCGAEEPDLVVFNDSSQTVGAIGLHYDGRSAGVSNADGTALMEWGDVYGLELEEEGPITVSLYDMEEQELVRSLIEYKGTRLYLTLEEDGSFSCSEVGP